MSARPNPLTRPASRPFDLYRKAEELRTRWVESFRSACKRNGIDPKASFVVFPESDERKVSAAFSAYCQARTEWLKATGQAVQAA